MYFEIYQDEKGDCYWRLRARETKAVIALSPRAYASVELCRMAIDQVVRSIHDTPVIVNRDTERRRGPASALSRPPTKDPSET